MTLPRELQTYAARCPISGEAPVTEREPAPLNGSLALNPNRCSSAGYPPISRLPPGRGDNALQLSLSALRPAAAEHGKAAFLQETVRALAASNPCARSRPPPGSGRAVPLATSVRDGAFCQKDGGLHGHVHQWILCVKPCSRYRGQWSQLSCLLR